MIRSMSSASSFRLQKLSAMRTASYFAERRERDDFAAFDLLMDRRGGGAPHTEDQID